MQKYEQEIYDKLMAGTPLTESELRGCVRSYSISDDYGENRRWSRFVASICQIGDKYFQIDWDEGLTESQPDEFYDQPYEVEKREYDKVVHVVEWIKVTKS